MDGLLNELGVPELHANGSALNPAALTTKTGMSRSDGSFSWQAGHWDNDGDRHAWNQGCWQRRDHDGDHDHGHHSEWDHGRGHDRDDRQ